MKRRKNESKKVGLSCPKCGLYLPGGRRVLAKHLHQFCEKRKKI